MFAFVRASQQDSPWSAATERPKKPKTAVAAVDSVSAVKVTKRGETTSTATTDTDGATLLARTRDRSPPADRASVGEQHHKADVDRDAKGDADDKS
jgi:hypothetical protein